MRLHGAVLAAAAEVAAHSTDSLIYSLSQQSAISSTKLDY